MSQKKVENFSCQKKPRQPHIKDTVKISKPKDNYGNGNNSSLEWELSGHIPRSKSKNTNRRREKAGEKMKIKEKVTLKMGVGQGWRNKKGCYKNTTQVSVSR